MELGKPVLCEKAFTTDAKQAKELFALAEEKGLYLAEAMWTWFSPVANKVKEWLDSGELGDIKRVKTNYHMDVRKYADRLTDPKRAGGALLDSGVYPITSLSRLFGKPVSVAGKGVLKDGLDMEENVDLTFVNGRTCRASISIHDWWGLERFAVVGTKAKITVPWFHQAKQASLKRKHGPNEDFRGDGSYLNEFDLVAEEIRRRGGQVRATCSYAVSWLERRSGEEA